MNKEEIEKKLEKLTKELDDAIAKMPKGDKKYQIQFATDTVVNGIDTASKVVGLINKGSFEEEDIYKILIEAYDKAKDIREAYILSKYPAGAVYRKPPCGDCSKQSSMCRSPFCQFNK
jgi:hypothetical protein